MFKNRAVAIMMGRARLYGAFAVAVAAIACYWELQDPRDHYAALGVSRSATTKEIRAGYKAKALLYHPDKVMSRRFAPWYVRLWRLATKGEARCARRFILASEAVETLADDEQRQIYDAELEEEERVVEVVGDEVEGAAGRVATTEDVDASREDEGRDSSLARVRA